MHPKIYQEFETICSAQNIVGSVLEVGAIPSNMSLLAMKSLWKATEKTGINLDGPYDFTDFKILKGNSNCMDCFTDEKFDAVLCNATLEHDKYFWKTLAEIKRVTKIGGLVVIGVPGYGLSRMDKLQEASGRLPILRSLRHKHYLDVFFSSTVTFQIHNAPGDYYRFSQQAVREVFFEGMNNVEIRSVMQPPRIIGSGIKCREI